MSIITIQYCIAPDTSFEIQYDTTLGSILTGTEEPGAEPCFDPKVDGDEIYEDLPNSQRVLAQPGSFPYARIEPIVNPGNITITSVVNTQPETADNSDGIVTASASGAATIEFKLVGISRVFDSTWLVGAPGIILPGLKFGDYILYARDQANPDDLASSPITVAHIPCTLQFGNPPFVATQETVGGGNDGTLTVNTAVGTNNGTVEYQLLDSGEVVVQPWQTSNVFSGIAPGNYYVEQRDTICEIRYPSLVSILAYQPDQEEQVPARSRDYLNTPNWTRFYQIFGMTLSDFQALKGELPEPIDVANPDLFETAFRITSNSDFRVTSTGDNRVIDQEADWSPVEIIDDLRLWLEGSVADYIENPAGFAQTWKDRTPNGVDFTQALAAERPAINLPDELSFDGVDDFLQADAKVNDFIFDDRGEITIVAKANASGPQYFTFGNPTDNNRMAIIVQPGDPGRIAINLNGLENWSVAAPIAIGTYYLIVVSSNSVNYRYFANNVEYPAFGANNNGKWVVDLATVPTNVTIGALRVFSGDFSFPIDTKAILYSRRPLTTTERLNLRQYLNNKYNIF